MEQILIERQNVLLQQRQKILVRNFLFSSSAGSERKMPLKSVLGETCHNNTLLQDKRYRKIWDGWLWLQALDEQVAGDSKRLDRDILSVIYWNTLLA